MVTLSLSNISGGKVIYESTKGKRMDYEMKAGVLGKVEEGRPGLKLY